MKSRSSLEFVVNLVEGENTHYLSSWSYPFTKQVPVCRLITVSTLNLGRETGETDTL